MQPSRASPLWPAPLVPVFVPTRTVFVEVMAALKILFVSQCVRYLDAKYLIFDVCCTSLDRTKIISRDWVWCFGRANQRRRGAGPV
jgi:hypothetical protein